MFMPQRFSAKKSRQAAAALERGISWARRWSNRTRLATTPTGRLPRSMCGMLGGCSNGYAEVMNGMLQQTITVALGRAVGNFIAIAYLT